MTAIMDELDRDPRESLRLIYTLVQREVRDSFRDWRIVVPILLLTLLFPVLMSIVADWALNWVAKYGASIVGDRMIPFLLMVVGFFPISFSLVIALETFVGEKERKSLEPLLATPLTDAQLYIGKTLAAMIPPLLAAYLGICVYLTGLYIFEGWVAPPTLIVLVLLLTTAECLVMVSGAVVVSSHTTSVRAANLLASFIIIPMTLLIQGEAMIMFWGNYTALWLIVVFLLVVDVVLVRMGIHIFNREELLGREIDQLNIAYLWRLFLHYLDWDPWPFDDNKDRQSFLKKLWARVVGLYLRDIPAILRRSKLGIGAVVAALGFAALLGWGYGVRYPLPSDLLDQADVTIDTFTMGQNLGMLRFSTLGIFFHNLRVLIGGALLGIFSFGTLAIALLMAPISLVFLLLVEAQYLGFNPWVFFAAGVLPHGVLEIPAAVLATGLAVRLGATFMSPPEGMTVGEGWIWALADLVKVFVAVVLPLLLIAAYIEVTFTPQILIRALAGQF